MGWPCLIVETDTSNPDIAKIVSSKKNDFPGTSLALIDLDNNEGWLVLGNIIGENENAVTLINSAARSADSVDKSGPLLQSVADALGKQLVVF